MGKIIIYLMLVVAIQVALTLFVGTGDLTVQSGNNTFINSATTLILQPQNWYSNLLAKLFENSFGIALLAVGGLIAGSFFIRNEWIFYISLVASFIAFIPPFFILYVTLSSSAFAGPATSLIVGLFFSPILLIILGIWLDFSRGKD